MPAVLFKFLVLGIIDIVMGIAISSAFAADSTILAWAMIIAIGFINYAYIFRAPTPVKFMAPGIVFLAAFVIVPIVYTVVMSGFKFQTGNIITKPEAITQVLARSVKADPSGAAFDITIGKVGNEYAALMHNQTDGSVSLATTSKTTLLAPGTYTADANGVPTAAPGFTPLTADEIAALGDKITELRFPDGKGKYVAPQYGTLGVLVSQDLTYNAKTDVITSASTGAQYVDNGTGNFANKRNANDFLTPGWRTANFPQNFVNLVTNPEMRDPFIRVFIWTVMFAFLSVFTTFLLGLGLALALDKPMRGRAVYRSILILPYAIPSFMSILVWRGMFNTDFGVINRLLTSMHLISSNVDWFNSTFDARVIVILVNLWLGFPYMYLISSGALQAIPSELKEAASIDGATGLQSLRRITMPLLLEILTPLLISSFAFNFNNFNIIYLLTGGGPREALAGERAGGTDILISYAYQTAISAPNSRDYGLASAISMFMFVIVAGLSMWSIRRSKALEEF
ncbi:MAG: ABC transporter permease subunit [Candidatus Nanopelagicales bacterium]